MNKIYTKLFSKDSAGRIRVWNMEQNDDKYRTISGLVDGEKVTTEWTVAKAKNEGKKNETCNHCYCWQGF